MWNVLICYSLYFSCKSIKGKDELQKNGLLCDVVYATDVSVQLKEI